MSPVQEQHYRTGCVCACTYTLSKHSSIVFLILRIVRRLRQVQGLYSFAIEMIFGLTVNDVRIEEVTGDVRSCLPSIDR